jgi:LacI family transcriptional regulator
MSVTLEDVAAEAGVSRTSVAHVLHRNDPRYSRDLCARVREAAQRLGYRRNELARALSLSRTHCIGFVGHSLRTTVTMEKVDAIATHAQQMGYHLFLSGPNEDGDRTLEQELIEGLLSRSVDGLIIHILPECDLSYYHSLQKRGVSLVLSGSHSCPEDLPIVSVDIASGIYEAMRHLLELGHRDIALALGEFSAATPHNRLEGAQHAFAECGLELAPGRVLSDRPSLPACVREFTQAQLSQSPRPTAILYNNDLLALAGMRMIRELGMEIPRDVSVVGVDDLPLAENTWPPLTTVSQPREELGRAAVKLLIKQIRGEDLQGQTQIVLPTELVVRQSTGPAPTGRR